MGKVNIRINKGSIFERILITLTFFPLYSYTFLPLSSILYHFTQFIYKCHICNKKPKIKLVFRNTYILCLCTLCISMYNLPAECTKSRSVKQRNEETSADFINSRLELDAILTSTSTKHFHVARQILQEHIVPKTRTDRNLVTPCRRMQIQAFTSLKWPQNKN